MSREDDNNRGSYRGRDEPRRSSRDEPERGRGRDEAPARGRGDDDRDRQRSSRSERGGRMQGSGSSAGFSYQPRSREDVEKRAQGKGDFDSVLKDHIKVYKVRNGDNCIRILPPTWAGKDGKTPHWGFDTWVHYGVGADRESYLDLQKMKGEADPVSEEYERQLRSGVPKEELRDFRATHRSLCYLVDRLEEEAGVQAWLMPFGLDQEICAVSIDKSSGEVLNIDDPKHGYDVNFDKSGEKMLTKYKGASIARRSSPLGNMAWLDFAMDNPLPDQLVYFPYEHIDKVFGGGGVHKEREEPRRDADDDRRGDTRSRDTSSRESRDDDTRDNRSVRGGRNARGDEDRGRDDGGDALTYEAVHAMTAGELDALCASDDRLDKIDPEDAKDDVELMDWICEDLKLEPKPTEPEPRARRSARDPEPEAEPPSRLAQMRAERGRR